MTKRTLAALLALLVTLAGLPLIAADPASAHPRYTQRCDYDPISGQNFNCRSVYVPHSHPKPKNSKPETSSNANPDSSGVIPEDTTPEDTTPEDTTPEDTTPEDTTPEDTTPEDTTPEDTTPEDTTPEDTTPEDTTPEDTTPEDTTPEDTPDDDPAGDETTTNPCEPWPTCNTSADPKPEPKPTVCWGPERRSSHDHNGTVDCHSRGHAPEGHSHAAPDAPGVVTDAIRNLLVKGVRKAWDLGRDVDHARQLARDAATETWDSLSPEQKIIAISVGCSAAALTGLAASPDYSWVCGLGLFGSAEKPL